MSEEKIESKEVPQAEAAAPKAETPALKPEAAPKAAKKGKASVQGVPAAEAKYRCVYEPDKKELAAKKKEQEKALGIKKITPKTIAFIVLSVLILIGIIAIAVVLKTT